MTSRDRLVGRRVKVARFGVSAVLVGVMAASSACRSTGLVFRADRSLQIVNPVQNALVTLPLRLRWTTTSLPPGAKRYAIFVDRAPVRPGRSLRDIADSTCQRLPGCPDETYLEQRNVYETSAPTLMLASLPDQRARNRTSARDVQELTIVVLDDQGRRIGEAFYSVSFRVRRGAAVSGGALSAVDAVGGVGG